MARKYFTTPKKKVRAINTSSTKNRKVAKMENNIDVSKIIGFVFITGIIIFLISVLFGSFYTIESGQEGVLFTFSKADTIAKGDGLHFKIPFVQDVVKFNIRTQKYEAHAAAASRDLQDVSTNVAVNYHIAKGTTPQIYANLGPAYESTVIQPTVQEVVKAVTAKYTAEELITKREDVKNGINQLLKERLNSRGLFVEDISITNFAFSQSFTQAIEAKVTAEQIALKAQRDLERVKVEAEQIRAKAEGDRDAAIAQATGEAEKVKLVQEQLERSPQYNDYIRAQRWDGKYPNVYIGGNGAVPLLQIPTPMNMSS